MVVGRWVEHILDVDVWPVLFVCGAHHIMKDTPDGPLEPRERAMMAFVEKVALNADRITAAARCFFSKLLDALGVQADSTFNDLDPALRDALTVGRPIDGRE